MAAFHHRPGTQEDNFETVVTSQICRENDVKRRTEIRKNVINQIIETCNPPILEAEWPSDS
jgi:hypothetical protein